MTSPLVQLHNLFLRGLQRVHDIAPSVMLQMRTKSIARAPKFIETKAEAAYADRQLRQFFADPHWALNAKASKCCKL